MAISLQREAQAALLVASLVVALPSVAHAGMPSMRLHEFARLRLEVVSFFLLGFLLSSAVVWVLWNYVRRDFAWLPRLGYLRACGVVALWGLLFVVVLTMISGAWESDGLTHRLADGPTEEAALTESAQLRRRRETQLAGLYERLAAFARTHEGRFPSREELPIAAGESLLLPNQSQLQYVYLPGRTLDAPPALLAYEPSLYDDAPLALFSDGGVEQAPLSMIIKLRGDAEGTTP